MRFFYILIILLHFSFAVANDLACSETSGSSALIIIDMQPFFANAGGNPKSPENQQKLKTITEMQRVAIDQAKANGIPIVFLEYTYAGMQFGETNDQLKAAVKDYKEVRFIKKDTDGMFDRSNSFRNELSDHLKKHKIGTLIITGANGGACVKESIIGALENNCNVIAYSKGIADFNFPSFKYPYAGHYANLEIPKCKNCSFREVSSLEEASKYMINENRAPSAVDTKRSKK